jgi:hypothetical protein
MRRDITRNQDYFVRLGIQVPKDLPPIRVQTGPNSGTNGIYAPESLPNYRWEMVIGENFVNDRTAATGMYGSFVIGQLVNDPKILKQFAGNLGTFMQPLLLWQSFSEYFNASFWNKRPAAAFPWATQLWKIRDKLGSDFTDRMAAYTLMSIVDNPAEGQETNFDAMKNFNIYFYRKLKVGDSVIDNESKRWAEIVQILKADGSYTDE